LRATAAKTARAKGRFVVEVDAVTKTFGDKLALADVSFSVPDGPNLRSARP
jgi:hypothetical protein